MKYSHEQVERINKLYNIFRKCEDAWEEIRSFPTVFIKYRGKQLLSESLGLLEEALEDPELFRVFTDADSPKDYMRKNAVNWLE